MCVSRYRLRLERQEALTLPAPEGLQSPEDAVPLLHQLVEEEPYELLGTLFLDFQNRVTGYNIAYMGTMTRVAAEARGVLLPALLANAATILLFHNHPGGDTRPSPDDITMTGIVRQAAYILGIRVWDHLILGDPPAYQSIGQFMAARRQPRPFRLPPMRPSKKARPKFRHPETGETWAGRGHMARWLREAIEAGADLEDFRVRG
jgi:DNA repair protein RadC